MLLGRRSVLVGMSALAAGAVLPNRAFATVLRPLSLGELVHSSRYVLVGSAVGASSTWETLGARRRIVTYTVVRVDRTLDGQSPSKEITVRTLGGRVGKIGQIVHGEATLAREERTALFLTELETDLFAVTGMAQGHYPLKEAGGALRLQRSPQADEVIDAVESAVRRLDGRTVPEAEQMILRELRPDAP